MHYSDPKPKINEDWLCNKVQGRWVAVNMDCDSSSSGGNISLPGASGGGVEDWLSCSSHCYLPPTHPCVLSFHSVPISSLMKHCLA